ncbi:MAG: hypothetical protein ABUL72_05120 [Armatimonadota bacterium]
MIDEEQLDIQGEKKKKVALGSVAGILVLYTLWTGLKLGEYSGRIVTTKTELSDKQKNLGELKSNQTMGLVDALMKEDASVSMTKFSQTVTNYASTNNVTIQRLATATGATTVATEPGKQGVPSFASRDVDLTLKGSMRDIYATVTQLSQTKTPFKLLSMDVIRPDKNSGEPGVVATLKAAVYCKGD